MKIAADHNIPSIDERCADLGEVRLYDSRDRQRLRRILEEADILLCRSTIQVNAALLEGTPVRFVATATAGTDHFDTAWLDAQGIAHVSAAGSNARSVAEWWVAALLEMHDRGRVGLEGASVGIVGVGHVGTQVADVARALGLDCRYNDPPRERRGEQPVPWDHSGFSSLDDLLSCDIVTLHVPLERQGDFPTAGFFGAEQFRRMRPGALFVNAARGGVMQPDAVRAWASAGNPVVLDVYPGEPEIDPALVRAADIATPHIAGHSWDGKLLGAEMVEGALRAWLGEGTEAQRHRGTEQAEGWYLDGANLGAAPPQAGSARKAADPEQEGGRRQEAVVGIGSGEEVWHTVQNRDSGVYSRVLAIMRGVYDIRVDDAALRGAAENGGEAAAAEFARLRAEYRVRREFAACTADAAGLSGDACGMLRALGFTVR